MQIDELDLNGGAFSMTLPYNFWGWVIWAIGLVLIPIGIVMTGENGPIALVFTMVGLLLMAFTTPGSFEASLHKVRQGAIDPAELEAKAQASGLSIDNWWLQQTTYVPTNDPSDWILPAPGPATWDENNRYGPHEDGSALPEHPVKVGTPIPASFTLFSVYSLGAIAIMLYIGLLITPTVERTYLPPLIISAIGLIATLIGYFRAKIIRQMMDTPTSLIRSMAVGNPELVGQVRPVPEGCLTVVVDGNQNMTVPNMVGYRWTYEQYQCRTTTDSEGNSKETCNWVTVRADDGGCPFILHDGTGGVRVNTDSFKRTDWGKYLKRWDGSFAQTLGKQLMASAVAGLLGGATIKKHRWTLYGLKLGNPVYLLGQASPRSQEALAAENLDGSLANSLLEVWGNEDAPGIKCTLHRGTELSNLGRSRSPLEMVMVPAILMIGGLALLGIA
ncbi:MAG: hypothetical protein ACKVIR_04935 [Candidatus Poseidoniales archaeon]